MCHAPWRKILSVPYALQPSFVLPSIDDSLISWASMVSHTFHSLPAKPALLLHARHDAFEESCLRALSAARLPARSCALHCGFCTCASPEGVAAIRYHLSSMWGGFDCMYADNKCMCPRKQSQVSVSYSDSLGFFVMALKVIWTSSHDS